MSDLSANLSLPFLIASQSQKHVTFNDLVNKIDALLMLSVKSNTLNTPPTSPEDGARYIIGNGANGEWEGKENHVATYQNLGWDYIRPQNGFLAFIESEGKFYCYTGLWKLLSVNSEQADMFTKLGIGTRADNINTFASKLNNALFSAKYVAENGDGNLRIKVNKENSNNTAAFLFQTNYSGRAEFGLMGNDSFGLKVSADGSNWQNIFNITPLTNITKFNNSIDFPADIQGSKNSILKSNTLDLINLARANDSDGYNTFIGLNSGGTNLTASTTSEASYNTAMGFGAMKSISSGNLSVGIGVNSLYNCTSGRENTALGAYSLFNNTSGIANTAIGHNSLLNNTTGIANHAIGSHTLFYNNTGSYNTAIGHYSLVWKQDGTNNTNYTNCCGIGNGARVSASNQIQLGDVSTTTYAYGAVQNRSDLRDKTDIRDTILGLDFINALRPVDFKWDMRDDYLEQIKEIDEKGNTIIKLIAHQKNGTKKRRRYHHGLIAQEVEQTLKSLGIDFGGFQDHSHNGGSDVKSIGYTELIAPLIRAVQELSNKIDNIKRL